MSPWRERASSARPWLVTPQANLLLLERARRFRCVARRIAHHAAALRCCRCAPTPSTGAPRPCCQSPQLWEASNLVSLGSGPSFSQPVSALAFSRDGKLLVSAAGTDQNIRPIDVATRKVCCARVRARVCFYRGGGCNDGELSQYHLERGSGRPGPS